MNEQELIHLLNECHGAFDAIARGHQDANEIGYIMRKKLDGFMPDLLAQARRAQPEANADAEDAITDTQRIDHIEAWSNDNKRRGFAWNTFTFAVNQSVRDQLDEGIKAARQAKESE